MVCGNYIRNMELLGFTVIGCHPSGMTVYCIQLPKKEENNQNNEGLENGKLGEIQENKGKKGISKAASEGA